MVIAMPVEWRGETVGTGSTVRIGRNVEVRPVGGAPGCLAMILVSIGLSVLLTVVINLVLR
jgi:hypothetical protein